jgi:hypothetical protein
MTMIDFTKVRAPQSSTTSKPEQDSISLAPAGEIATAASPPGSTVIRRSRFAWLGMAFTRRQYHHPQRERFVEDAAMSREMFRL